MPISLGPSVGETIMATIAAELNAPADKPATTYRSRTEALATNEQFAFLLRTERETGDMRGTADLRRRRIILEAIARDVAPADSSPDQMYVYAVRTLYGSQALKDVAIGLVQTDIEWRVLQDVDDIAIAAIAFEFVYAQVTDDPVTAFTGR